MTEDHNLHSNLFVYVWSFMASPLFKVRGLVDFVIVALISVVNYNRFYFIAMPGPSRATDEVEEDECDTEDELRKYESSINSTTIIDIVFKSLDGIVEDSSLIISCTT